MRIIEDGKTGTTKRRKEKKKHYAKKEGQKYKKNRKKYEANKKIKTKGTVAIATSLLSYTTSLPIIFQYQLFKEGAPSCLLSLSSSLKRVTSRFISNFDTYLPQYMTSYSVFTVR